MKHRGSKHGDSLYPYSIETGLGVVLRASQKQIERVKPRTKFNEQFKDAIEKTRAMGEIGERLSSRIRVLQKNWTRDEDPSHVLKLVLGEDKKETAKRLEK
jgi:hypothetical protein